MALKSGVITHTGSAQAFHTAMSVPDEPIQWLSVQPDGGNANATYIGPSGVASTNGIYLQAGNTSVPPAPYEVSSRWDTGPSKAPMLSDWYAIGTNTQKLRVFWIPG